MAFKHLFFDLDNTILDFTHASHLAFRDLLDHFGQDEYDSYDVYHKGNLSVWQEFEKGEISALNLRAKRFKLFHEKMGWVGDGLEWNKVYMEHIVQNNKFVDGAYDVIKKLSQNYHLHVVTNGLKEAQRPRISKAGLDPFFTSITVSDEIGSAKPQANFFESAIRTGHIKDPSEILMIGDGYGSDIKGGHEYGLKTCWFNHDKLAMDSKIHDYEIHHITDLHKIL